MRKLKRKEQLLLLHKSEQVLLCRNKHNKQKHLPNKLFQKYNHKKLGIKKLIAPSIFKLISHEIQETINTLFFINKIKKEVKNITISQLKIKLTNIKDIDEGGIAILLSVIQEATRKGIYITGTKPKDRSTNDKLEQSGFFKFFKTSINEENQKSKNRIFATGDKDTSLQEIANAITDAMKTIWEVDNARCPELYCRIIEMQNNSRKHAFTKIDDIVWHLSLSHDDNKKLVKFSFVDNGIGIYHSYKRRHSVKKKIKNWKLDSIDILKVAFEEGRIGSQTGLSWRGKGLPTIYELLEKGIASKFVVITNKFFMDFSEKKFLHLQIPFEGTFYYWEINNHCKKNYFI